VLSQKPWRIESVLLFFAALFCCFFLTAVIALTLQKFHVAGFVNQDDFGFLLLGTLGVHGAAWILIFIFLWLHQVNWRDAFGFRGPNLGKALLLALGVLILILPITGGLKNLSDLAFEKIGWQTENQRAIEMFLHAKSFWYRAYLGFFAVVLAPVAEEFIFRGILFPFFKQRGFPKLAWFGVSFLFALIHGNPPIFISLFVLALALTWLYEKTDNLLAPIAVHASFNGINLIALQWLQKISPHGT
jgi:membrane protease YdiL (CAAX protease family)